MARKNYAEMTKEEIEKAERKKLNTIYSKLDTKTKRSVDSLVDEAAFVGASLYELRQIINEKGYTEEYTNGQHQKGIKKCSEVEIYNTMLKNYASIVKQLTDLLPKETKAEVGDAFTEFAIQRKAM